VPDRPIHILCVEDNDLVASALETLVRTAPDLRFAGRLAMADEMLAVVDALTVDVVLLDLLMPGVDTMVELRRLTAERPNVRVLVLSAYGDAATVDACLDSGAAGYFSKHCDTSELIDGIRAVMRGELAMDRMTRDHVFGRRGNGG